MNHESYNMESPAATEVLPMPEFKIEQKSSLDFIAQSIGNYEDIKDEEAVFMLALTLDHPEWKDEILQQIARDKPHIQNPEKILARISKDYYITERQPRSQSDTAWWTEHLPETKTRIANLLTYFHPSQDAVAKKIIIVPSDQLLPSKDTGRSFHIGNTAIIMSHSENLDNFEHEFLHSIINPLTRKVAGEIPQEKIIALASNKLKNQEMYGNHALSLLNEELIRTYNDLIKRGEPIRTFADFEKLVKSIDEKSFADLIDAEPITKARLSAMGIFSLADFQTRIKEYYDRYEKNSLREKIYQFYKKFNTEKAFRPDAKFEDFFLKNANELFI